MAVAATDPSLDPTLQDPQTVLRQRILSSLNPNVVGSDPTAQGQLPGGSPSPAPFASPPPSNQLSPVPAWKPQGVINSSPTEGLPPSGPVGVITSSPNEGVPPIQSPEPPPPPAPQPSPEPPPPLGPQPSPEPPPPPIAVGYQGSVNTGTPVAPAVTTPASPPVTPTTPVAPPVLAGGSTRVPRGDPNNTPPGQTEGPGGPGTTQSAIGQPPAGIDPALWAIYQKGGLTPADRGSGFADWQYWQDKGPSTYARLAADIAGTGTDNPQGTPGQGSWSASGAGGNGGAGGPGGAPGSGSGSDPFSQYLAQLEAQQAAQQAQQQQLRDYIMQQLQAAGQPVDESQPQIAQPLSAAQDAIQRSQDAEKTALAEHLYAQGSGGLQSGELGQQIQQSAEQNATGLSQLRAGLITQQYAAQQQKMETLLQQALASGDTQSAQLLQAQIAALNAAVSREGLGINLSEFLANLNQNAVNTGANG